MSDSRDPPNVTRIEAEENRTKVQDLRSELILARQVFSASELAGLPIPPRYWIVEKWVPRGYVTALYGDGGLGKSLLALQLQVALAVGGRWLGVPVPKMKTYGVYCEDDKDEVHRRLHDICRQTGVNMADLDDARIECRHGMDNLLMTFDQGAGKDTPLAYQLGKDAKAFGAELFIFDTLADGFPGNQNNMSDARQFINLFARIARYLNTSGKPGGCWVNAHPSRAGMQDSTGTSGSVQWGAALRSRLYLSEPSDDGIVDPNARVLTRKKANYAARDETIELMYRSGALVLADETADEGEQPSVEAIFLEILSRMTTEGQRVSHTPRAGNYAPKIFTRRPERRRYRMLDFERAMHQLLAMREIEVVEYLGPNRRQHECIQRVGGPADDVPF